ncbi:MAG: 5-oxoprolinase subunit B/C family protein [Methylovirgula sp.]
MGDLIDAGMRFLPAGESALVVEFGTSIDPALNERVRDLDAALAAARIAGIIETVPTYRSLMIHFDPHLLSSAALIERVSGLEAAPLMARAPPHHWIIPVCYEAPYAEDLAEVAAALGLSETEIIALHAGATYRVYMYGFAPGYVFLGGLPEPLAISRRAVPRPPVPAGSLLIAGGQALIGHDPMPTGWYQIGRTPVATFDAAHAPPCFIEIGDAVRFEPIAASRFAALEQAARDGAQIARAASEPKPVPTPVENRRGATADAAADLRILRAGPGVTIQDGGRHFYRRYGISPAGPMDWRAFHTANLALGNDPDAAAIEIGLGGLEICCTKAAVALAFCGGGFAWTRDGQAVGSAMRLMLQPGRRLVARPGESGAFAYLAVAGGLDTPEVLGSRATHTRAHLGGIDGRMLQEGDALSLLAGALLPQEEAEIAAAWLAADASPLRVVLGPQQDYFTDEALALFFSAAFRLTHSADRMAYRLEGPQIAHARGFNIVSDGIAEGAIQIAGDGQLLVLMADHQPTGGYPKLGHVIRADIGRLAQLRPGATCRFAPVDVATARVALLTREEEILQTRQHVKLLRRNPSAEDLLRINLISGIVDGRSI